MTSNEGSALGHGQRHSDHLDVRVAPLPGIPNSFCFYITGYIDSDNTVWFRDQVRPVLMQEPPAVLFELSGLTYTGDVGLGNFWWFLKTVRQYGGALALCSVPQPIREVFTLLGFPLFFDLDYSYQDAVDSLARRYIDEEPHS